MSDAHVRSARYLDRIAAGLDDAADARDLDALIRRIARIEPITLVDVGCGTGRHLAHLRDRYDVAGVDVSEAMLAVARTRLPDLPLHLGDMATFDLGRCFDAVVCLGGTVGYATTPAGLRRTIDNLGRHASPGGVVAVAPWLGPDDWEDGWIGAELVDDPDVKIAQMAVGGRDGGVATIDYHYLVASPAGVERWEERHALGLFPIAAYVAALEAAGLETTVVPEVLHGWDLVVGVRS